MDMITPLFNLSVSSIFVTSGLWYLTNRSLFSLSDPKFYGLFYLTWLVHFFAWAFYRIIIRPKHLSSLRHLPEPTEGRSWWNGYAGRAYWGMRGSAIAQWQNSLDHKGFFRYLGILNSERLVFTSVNAVVEVLERTNDFIQPELLSLLISPVIGRGLVLLNGEEHKRQRKQLLPSFSMKQLRHLHPVYWEKAVEITNKFTEIIESSEAASGFSEPIEIDHYAGLVGLDVISKAALGVDFESVKNPDGDLVRNYRGTFEPTLIFQAMAFMRLLLPRSIVESLPLERVRDGKKAIHLLRTACLDSVREKKALMEKGELVTNDIISALIRDRQVSDDEELLVHMLMMLGAGHETVAVGLTWAVYELCRQPSLQHGIRAEVRQHLPSPDSGDVPSTQAFGAEDMPLLHAFLSEVLRYWPPAPQIVRTAVKDTTVAGVFIPATTKLQLSIVAFNRDPQNWGADAGSFNPERWLHRDRDSGTVTYDPTGKMLNKHGFMTFIHGPRDCIGRVFARQEMLNVLSCWIGRFDFVLTEQSYMEEKNIAISGGGLTSKPLHGIHVHARRVLGW